MRVDASSYVAVTGRFNSTLHFGSDDFEINSGPANTDGFVAAYTNSGDFLWANTILGETGDFVTGTDISIGPEGNVYVIGNMTEGEVTFSSTDDKTTKINSPTSRSVFLARYNSTGSLTWVRILGDLAGGSTGGLVSAKSDGSVFVTIANDGKGLLSQVKPNGELDWQTEMTVSGEQLSLLRLQATSDKDAVIIGSFTGELSLRSEVGNGSILMGPADNAVFVARYTSDGELSESYRLVVSSTGDFLPLGAASSR